MSRPRADPPGGAQARPKVSPAAVSQAAIWVTKLHGPDRTPEMERAFLAWQAQSAENREAFEKCTDAWVDVGNLKLGEAYEAMLRPGPRRSHPAPSALRRWAATGAAACLVAVGIVAGHQWWERNEYDTEVGELRVVILDDGTRMRLNTDTDVRVKFDGNQRLVSVRHGEAIFEVAKDPLRPFVVRASGSEVVAVGTAFVVRYQPADAGAARELAITLIEGQVNVRPAVESGTDTIAPDKSVTMKAGERLRLSRDASGTKATAPSIDRPDIEGLTAWKRSMASFDDTKLVDAVAEMNRYSRTPIVVVDSLSRSNLSISGQYRTGDNAAFAEAVAHLHGLRVVHEDRRLRLEKAQ